MRIRLLILCIVGGIHADLLKAKSAVIVNPLYNSKDDIDDMNRPDPNAILPPTHRQLMQTEHIRNIINKAVRSGTYAVGDSTADNYTPTIQPKKPMLSWLMGLLELKSNKELSSSNTDVDNGSGTHELDEQVGTDQSQVTGIPLNKDSDSSGIKSNLIDSAIVSGLEKKPLTFGPRKVQREQLHLVSVEENLNFPYGQNIQSWITVQRKTGDKHALIGITNRTLVLITEENDEYKIVEELDLEASIMCFTNYLHWNHTSTTFDGVIIVGIGNQLIFISTREDLQGLEIIWKWTIHSTLQSLAYFANNASNMILMINAPTANNEISANIYKFDLDTKHTWLIQKIPLYEPCKSVQILDTYRDLVLCFVQNNTVELYKSDRYSINPEIFQFYLTIDANNVQTVSGFKMGGYSYLAITGLEPKIFRYHRGNFIPQTILSQNWGLVEFIFPIPARTYRDDLILLVQHRFMMGTHSVLVVEALIWDGEAFDVSLSIPCRIGDNIVDLGLSCLLDYDRHSGIDGLSIIQNGNSISLIIPRFDAPSSMFRMRFKLKSFDTADAIELKEFEMACKDVEMTMNYQNEILSKGNDALAAGITNNGGRNDVSANWNLANVKSDNLILNDGIVANVEEIYVGNEKWTEENVLDLMNILQEYQNTVDQLEREIMDNHLLESNTDSPVNFVGKFPINGGLDVQNGRVIKPKSRHRRSGGASMHVNKLEAKNINVEYINGIPIDDIVFTQDGVLNSVDSLVVENRLKVLNDVNISSIPNEVVGENTEDRHLKDDVITAESIHVKGDLTVDSINGILWEHFIQQVVMRNSPTLLAELTVEGDILVKGDIQVNHLSEIPFPSDYLWMHDSDVSAIAGHKVFNGKLTTESIDTEHTGTVDGINTQETIALLDEQYIPGLTTFAQLEITESLDVNGTINGKHLSEFKPNRSLLEATIIPSDCLFQTLEVHGPIYISNHCNGLVIDDILADVVYKSNPKEIIASFKTFESIESVVQLTSNLINGISVDNYMTLNTEQDIHFDRLIGNVMIKELIINGLFDFINVTELDLNSIKLMGEQFTEAEIKFEDKDEINIVAESFEIQKSFNKLTVDKLIRIDESLELDDNLVINKALVKDLLIIGQVNGKAIVNGISLDEFDMTRLSRTQPQDITSKYLIENAVIENNIDSTFVNGISIEVLRQYIEDVKNLPDFLTSIGVKLSNFVVDGNLVVNVINGHMFNIIVDNAIWLNKPNTINGNLEFFDKITIENGISVNSVNNEVFEHFIAGLVLKNYENIEFSGRKIFQHEFHIEQDLNANTINGVFPQNIWTRRSAHEISNPVNIIGNLIVEDLNVQGYLNSVLLRNIADKYNFNVDRQSHVVTNNIQFQRPTAIQNLQIQNGLNGVSNISDFLSNIIRKNHNEIITGKKRFTNNVLFVNDLQVILLDTVDVSRLFDNMVINDINENIVIVGDVAFEGDVQTPLIHVSGNILASNVMGCSLLEWNRNALRTNFPVKVFKRLVFPVGTFRTADISLEFLNGYSMAANITLNTNQHFPGTSFFSDIVSFNIIDVRGLVNGHDVRELVDNSVMVTGDHHIKASTIFQTARVLDILQTIGTINGIDLNNVATLHEDLNLYGPLSFRTISARSLNTKDYISGIDFDYWYTHSLWKSQRDVQIITGTWTVTNGIFHSSLNGQATINGIPINNIVEQIGGHQSNVLSNLETFNSDYTENCRKMANVIEKTRKVSYFLSHFEKSFSMHEQNIIHSAHFFNANGNSYLVMNLGCITVVYIWKTNLELYERVCETETGNVNSWLDVQDESNVINLISNTEEERSNCPTSGLNVWKFDGITLTHVSKIADANKFSFLHNTKTHPKRFLALTKDNFRVNEYDLQNNLVEEWHLPINDQKFRFLPSNANLGLALSNGKQLSILSSTKSIPLSTNRNQRSTEPFAEALGENFDTDRSLRCSFLEKQFHNFTENCKLLQRAKLKAFSDIGPFRNLEPAVGNRLINDYKMTTNNLGRFTPRINPLERGPQSSASFMPIQENKFSEIKKNEKMVNTTSRDAFGEIEGATIDIADKIVDALIEFDTEEEDVDFDDSFIGSSSRNQSQKTIKPQITQSNSINNVGSQTINPLENIDFDDSFIGSSSRNQSQKTIKPQKTQSNSINNVSSQTINQLEGGSQSNASFVSIQENKFSEIKKNEKILNTTSRDAFGEIEGATIDIADKIVDALIEFDTEEEDIDFDDSFIGSSSGNQSEKTIKPQITQSNSVNNVSSQTINPLERGLLSSARFMPIQENKFNEIKNNEKIVNTTSRDAFGEIEGATIDIADKIVDALIEIDTEEEDIDFDDSFVGSSSGNQSEKTIKPQITQSNSINNVSSQTINPLERGLLSSVRFMPIQENKFDEIKNNQKIINTTARDAFGEIEGATIDIADKIVDALIEIDTEEEDIDFDDSFIGSSSKNQSEKTIKPQITQSNSNNVSSQTIDQLERGLLSSASFMPIQENKADEIKNNEQTVNTTARDAFGEIEGATIDIADSIVDASRNQSQKTDKPQITQSDSINNVSSQTPTSRDMFGKVEEKATKVVDKVMDAFVNIKEKAKENYEKFNKMFHSNGDDEHHLRNNQQNSDEQKSQSNELPKIPQVNYNRSIDSSTNTMETTQFPQDNISEHTTTLTASTTAELTTNSVRNGENVGIEEQKISKEIASKGIATAENFNFPSHPAEEIVVLTVGENQKHLIAVSSLQDHTIQGKHDLIRIYEDIIEGQLFQTLICQRPRSLTVLNIRDESILAFIENDVEVQIYVYRGIQGFVKFTSFEQPSYIIKLTSVHLPVGDTFACSKSFLAVTMKKEIVFIEAKSCGYCGINAQLRCD